MIQFFQEEEDLVEEESLPAICVEEQTVKQSYMAPCTHDMKLPNKRALVRGPTTDKIWQDAVNKVRIGIRVMRGFQFYTTKSVARAIGHDSTFKERSQKYTKQELGPFPGVLRLICRKIRQTDQCFLVVELTAPRSNLLQYLVMLRHRREDGGKEDMLIAVEAENTEDLQDVVFVLCVPITSSAKVHLDGDGRFTIVSASSSLVVKPSTVQSQWAALNFLTDSLQNAMREGYYDHAGSHQWCQSYYNLMSADPDVRTHWKVRQRRQSSRRSIIEIFEKKQYWLGYTDPECEQTETYSVNRVNEARSGEELKKIVLVTLRNVMHSIDLDHASCGSIREEIEHKLCLDLAHLKEFVDEKILLIYGQMDEPSEILDYIYLGTEWNACNIDEMLENKITHVLNCTAEIESFYKDKFKYLRLDVLDVPQSNLLRYWDTSYKFIKDCKDSGGRVLIHCQMGVSRSASSTMSYIMREYGQCLELTYSQVKEKRGCVKPNPGFHAQLTQYEAALEQCEGDYTAFTTVLENIEVSPRT